MSITGLVQTSGCLVGVHRFQRLVLIVPFRFRPLPIGPQVVPYYGLYLESYKVIPKRNYLGAYG